jgi:F0F1-type ATP synthase assembly protein I
MGLLAGTLIATGLAVLAGYGIYQALDRLFESLPVAVTVGLVILLVGFLVFVAAMVRARVIAARECGEPPHTHPEKDESLR